MAEVVEIPAAFALGPRLTFGFIGDVIFTPMAHDEPPMNSKNASHEI